MSNDLKQAAQQALEALCLNAGGDAQVQAEAEAIGALRAALEQPEQEPVAWRYQNSMTDTEYLVWNKGTGGRNWTPLYTHPPRREWQSLSEEEVEDLRDDRYFRFARAVEAALKEKNHE